MKKIQLPVLNPPETDADGNAIFSAPDHEWEVIVYQKKDPNGQLRRFIEHKGEIAEFLNAMANLNWGQAKYLVSKIVGKTAFEELKEAIGNPSVTRESVERAFDKFAAEYEEKK